MPHQALCIMSSSYVNSNGSYGLETDKLGLTSVTLTLTIYIDITSVNGNNLKSHDDLMMGT